MPKTIVNGLAKNVPAIKACTDVQFGFKSRNQLPLFMVWQVWYDDRAEVIFGVVLFNSMDWIGR